MSIQHGSKRLVVGAGFGLADWLVQRVSALFIALYVLLVVALYLLPGASFAALFTQQWFKALTFVLFVAVAYHAWIGVRDIFMDYIKSVVMRILLHSFALIWIIAVFGWAVQVLWKI